MDDATASNSFQPDDRIRHEAALAYADGGHRDAINILIHRINATNGRCSPRIWLMLLDIYKILGQQAPYEKLAVFFSTLFQYSPPAWDNFDNPNKPKQSQGQWRNALVVEGSPLVVNEEKARDFVRASREAGHSRMDLSRMRIDTASERIAQEELGKLLEIMQRLRRVGCPTLLMGETELLSLLQHRINQKHTNLDSENIYWMILFELFQWRGQEEKFDQLADAFAAQFAYCPVGYDPQAAIAVAPSTDTSGAAEHDGFDPGEVVLEATALMEYARLLWQHSTEAHVAFLYVKQISSEAARDLAAFLQAQEGLTPTVHMIIHDTTEIIAALFETTGVGAYAQVKSRHSKLLGLLEKAA